MTPIHRERVDGPMAWVGGDFRSKDELAFDLSARNVAALEDILARVKNMARDEITRAQAAHPDLDDDLAKVYKEVMHGRGLVLVRGFPVEKHSIDDIEKIYWAFCLHFGNLLSNNAFGHRMVRVQEEQLPGGVQPARGTKSRAELAMHNDSGDTFMLLCVHQALSGGESQFSSGVAAHNTILARRPDLLPILYRGFPQHRRSEQQPGQPDVTPYDVPIFSNVNGRISINFTYSSILPALHVLGRKTTPQEDEALDLIRSVLFEQQLEIRMEPCEASVANNFAMCHSRSNYVDGPLPEQKRLVLRAWTEVPAADRRLPVGREFFLMENAGGRLGYDPVPGLDGSIARNDYSNVPEDLAQMFKAAQAKPKGVKPEAKLR
ncbi:MAG TPA: TauD/TfdA family dioxygenase [Burkholderiales bacterium]|nr:TauD/TfdA family dioxygenase [Burkholderiales bacterium]